MRYFLSVTKEAAPAAKPANERDSVHAAARANADNHATGARA